MRNSCTGGAEYLYSVREKERTREVRNRAVGGMGRV